MPFPELGGDMPLLPARMVNEYQYCPRLAYLEWVQGEWAAPADTVEGNHVHRRVDRPPQDFPEAGEIEEHDVLHGRSITLSSNRLGLIAKLDLIEAEDGKVTPVRPLIDDSTVQQAINNGEARPTDFISAAGSVALNDAGRKRFIAAFKRRLSQEITHPLFGYKVDYRRLFEIQARLFQRYLPGELPEYPNFTTR